MYSMTLLIADEARKLGFPVHQDIAGVEGLEVSKAPEVEGDEQGNDLAFTQLRFRLRVGLPLSIWLFRISGRARRQKSSILQKRDSRLRGMGRAFWKGGWCNSQPISKSVPLHETKALIPNSRSITARSGFCGAWWGR